MTLRRPHLVLLPGFMCDAELWRDQLEGLADQATCSVADLTGEATLEALAASVLRDAPPVFSLAGFSFGGYVAQEIARQAPTRVERLALLDTSAEADPPERAALRKSLSEAARLPGTFRGITDRMLPTFIHPARVSDTDLVERIKAMTLRLGRHVFLRQNAMERRDGEAALRALGCPILVLCGAEDVLTPAEDHRRLAAALPTARLVVIQESGHMTPMERPEEVTRALQDWLSE